MAKTFDDYVNSFWGTSLKPGFVSRMSSLNQRVEFFENTVRLNDPTRQLRLGYSITRHKGKVVRGLRDVEIGAALKTRVSDGVIESNVKGLLKNEQEN